MKIKVVDVPSGFDLETAKSKVEDLLPSLDKDQVMALFVLSDGGDMDLYELLELEAYKISGHEEEVPDVA